jgi:DNA-binding LytR/AlgR family response regulator
MKALLIEDEPYAVQQLKSLLAESAPDVNLIAVLDSIVSSVEWFAAHSPPDLVFMDVHLADGSCFEIFNHININAPVVFITAYDQYALEAFRVNGLDYLLKPLKKKDLERSLERFYEIKSKNSTHLDYERIAREIFQKTGQYQKRLLIRYGQKITIINISDVAYFYAESKDTLICTFDKRHYPADQNLEQLQNILSPEEFFRVNRKFLINSRAITSMTSYSRSRIKLHLDPPFEEDVIVSTDKTPGFKNWLTSPPK